MVFPFEANQVIIKKGLPPELAYGMLTSAAILSAALAWCLATASAHSLPTMPVCDFTLKE